MAMEGPVTGSVSASTASTASSSSSTGGSVSASSVGSSSESRWKGRILKRFKLIDLLGQGSMGKVFRAEDIALRRLVAIKVLPTKTRSGERDHKIDQFIREARSAASIEHPNAVTVYEIGESSGVHYIAMELVEGGNLEKLVKASGPMEIERACQVIAEAAEALSIAHAQGIIHRDVKPSNLLLSRNGRCKLADFGLARFDDPDDPNSVRGECVGTPCYIAPELPLGQKATPQSDIYSLGCTLWFLLTGRSPYEARTRQDMMKMHVYASLPDLHELRHDVPERLIEAITRACAKNPTDRFESADQFAKVLRTFTIPTGGSGHLRTLSASLTGSSGSITPWAPEAMGMASSSNLGPNISSNASGFGPAPLGPDATSAPRAGLLRVNSPILWAGIGTVAAVVLICVGVWIARGAGSVPAPAAASILAPTRTPAPAPPVTTRSGRDVVVNGSIEQMIGADRLAGWNIAEKSRPNVSFRVEGANRFVRLTSTDAEGSVSVDQKIPVDPSWVAVTISVRMRASGFTRGKGASHDARVALAFRDDQDKRVGKLPPTPYLRENSPWVEKTVKCDVTPGAKHLYVQLAMFYCTGIVDFDDIRIIPQIADVPGK